MIQKPPSRRPGKAVPAPPPAGCTPTSSTAAVPGPGLDGPVRTRLAQQQSDFTAEGSPPPGKVATAAPVRDADAVPPAPAPDA